MSPRKVSAGAAAPIPEAALQAQAAEFLALQYRSLLAWHTPNGGKRDPITAAMLRSQGVLPGVPDWTFVLADGRAAFIEMKSADGRLSAEQERFRSAAEAAGARYAVARSLEDFQTVLRGWKDEGLLEPAAVRQRRNPGGLQFPWSALLQALADHVRTYTDPQFWTLSDADRLDALAAEVRGRARVASQERHASEATASGRASGHG